MHTGVLQTARTIDKGEAEFIVASGFPDIFQFSGRYGIKNNVDMGVKFNLLGMLMDVKYKFYDDEQTGMAVSFAPGIGYSAAAWYDYSSFYDCCGNGENNLGQVHLPIYLSYHPTKSFALYFSPRYIFGIAENSDNLDDNIKNHLYHIYGGAVGIKIGDEFGVVMELNFGGVEPYNTGIRKSFRIQGIHLGIHLKTSSK